MVFETCGHHVDLGPAVQQFARKVLLLRRIMARYPDYQAKAKAAICAYSQQGREKEQASTLVLPWLSSLTWGL